MRPGGAAVGEVGGQAFFDGVGEQDGASGQVQAALVEVAQVGQGQGADLGDAGCVEDQQCGDGGPGGVG